ncbi:hypothetical protein Chor_014670 [Crotalus horridus]
MVPSKCRPAGVGRPGHTVSVHNAFSFSHFVLQLELRLHKEQPYLHNRFLQHDLEKNHPGKLVEDMFSFPPLDIYRDTGFPLVYRSTEEKIQLSDRMTLERQKLTVCPIIDGEEHLRLLSFQHNFITRIQNISNLQHLIFLDLYDNQIEEISGLSTLRCLRVLSLGNNRIRRISNLDNLVNLDVLDLHGNQISLIENLSHLRDLRMLNLARNCLTHVGNLSGLDSLLELNLRYNKIRLVKDVDTLPSLQRLFLSFNNVSCVEDILCLADSTSISELTLDGNPIAQEACYKPTILHHMMQLRQLDMKKITEEERRLASVALRKEEEKRRESHRQTLLKEKKRLTICNIAHHWEIQQNRLVLKVSNQEPVQGEEPCQNDRNAACEFPEEGRPRKQELLRFAPLLPPALYQNQAKTEEGGQLRLLVSGDPFRQSCARSGVSPGGSRRRHPLPVRFRSSGIPGPELERSDDWKHCYHLFIFIDFDEIIPVLSKLKIKFPNFLASCVSPL